MKDKSCWASQKFEAPNHKRRFVKSMLYKAIWCIIYKERFDAVYVSLIEIVLVKPKKS